MKVVAQHWLNYNGVWHRAGEEFEVENLDEVKEYVQPLFDTPVVTVAEMTEKKAPAKRGRPKKTGD